MSLKVYKGNLDYKKYRCQKMSKGDSINLKLPPVLLEALKIKMKMRGYLRVQSVARQLVREGIREKTFEKAYRKIHKGGDEE